MQQNELNIPPHVVNKLAAQLIETYRFSDSACAALKADNNTLRTIFSMYKAAFEINLPGDPGKTELLNHLQQLLTHLERVGKILDSEQTMAQSVKQLFGEFVV